MFVMLFILLSGIALQQLQKSEDHRLVDEMVEDINLNTVDLFKTDADIYNFDVTDADFYTKGSTPLLLRHDTLTAAIHQLVKTVRSVKDFKLGKDLTRVDSLLLQYDRLSKLLVEKFRRKGFKEFGLEGSFRTFAHALEEKKLISANEILMLRRHEKDYLLRGEKQYANALNTLSASLTVEYKNSPPALELLKDYTATFNELVNITEQIGFHSKAGLNEEVHRRSSALRDAMKTLNKNAELETKQNHAKTNRLFTIVSTFAVIFCAALIYLTARNL